MRSNNVLCNIRGNVISGACFRRGLFTWFMKMFQGLNFVMHDPSPLYGALFRCRANFEYLIEMYNKSDCGHIYKQYFLLNYTFVLRNAKEINNSGYQGLPSRRRIAIGTLS